MRTILEAIGVAKGFGTGGHRSEILADVNLKIAEGEFVAIVGFSGSGKTTLMQLLTGLIAADAGALRLRGQPYSGTNGDIGLVFQNYSLLPWLTVYGNIALAVGRVFPHWSRKRRHEHVMQYIDMVSLTAAAHKRPRELSGGMRQRVSLARTLSMQPKVLLLDEPLSALDALTRSVLQREILSIWERQRTTCVLITNDVDEALLMADRIITLTPGPKATLGHSFVVDLTRPRNRTELNHDATFKSLRNEITKYLTSLRDRSRRGAESLRNAEPVSLPPLRPVDLACRVAAPELQATGV